MKPEIKRRFERLVERLEFSELADGRFSDKDGKRRCDYIIDEVRDMIAAIEKTANEDVAEYRKRWIEEKERCELQQKLINQLKGEKK